MTVKLVKIDTKKNIYSYYEGKKKVHEFISDQPVSKEYVEEFRTNARSMINDMDAYEGNDPDGDLVA